jgi:ACS family tartrate transporter-like MFS transporter
MDVVVPAMSGVDPLERQTIKRVAWRLMPLLMLGYFCAYLDRSNVGMAATTMVKDLGFSNAVFGFGAGVFFLGYCLAEIPSNLILNMVGARRWLARILLTWGIIAGLTAFVWNDWSFYIVRFLLGLGEAGFYPGVVLYLTWWFPSYYRTRMMAIFSTCSSLSLLIGMPISGLLLQLDGALGLYGWQWLFLLEAAPPVIMAVITWQLLTDRPTEATWLRPEQRTWLAERLASEQAQREAIHKFSLGQTFSNPKIWLLSLAYVGQTAAQYGLAFFMPLIVKGLGVSTSMIGVVSALPYVFGLSALLFWGWHSDITGERTWHTAGAWLLTSGGMAACILIGASHPVVTMGALILAVMGSHCAPSIFWSLPTALLTGTAAAGGIAMINAVGSLGGWLGPWMFGVVKDATGSDSIALLCLAAAPAISAIVVIAVGHDRRLERMPPRA